MIFISMVWVRHVIWGSKLLVENDQLCLGQPPTNCQVLISAPKPDREVDVLMMRLHPLPAPNNIM